jgi:pimeloyl-ACP methyl ester carboxylesterase
MSAFKLPVQTAPFLWGAAAGAITLAIVGFNWGGWVTGSTAAKAADAAMVAALAPICVAQFRLEANAPARLAAFKEVKSWEQGDHVGKSGWATMPGSSGEPNRQVAMACAEALNKLVL